MSPKKNLSTKRLIERLERDSRTEDAMEIIRRATKGDDKAAEFVLKSVDDSKKGQHERVIL
jgi:hypothetical protein